MISINNLTNGSCDEEFLEKVGEKILKEEKKKEKNLSIALIGSGRMRKLNKKYRGKNRITDVLAFPSQVSKKQPFIFPSKEKKELGEIIICLPVLRKNAKRYKSTFEKEMGRVLIHGILHLLGHDHEKSEKEAKKMKEKEEYYLSKVT